MNENYTCICGNEKFMIHGAELKRDKSLDSQYIKLLENARKGGYGEKKLIDSELEKMGIIERYGHFSCLQCGRLFECGIDETAKEFNKRIRKEARKR